MAAPWVRVGGLAGVRVVGDRAAQTVWVLDHEEDIDADFLACYGIDLATYPMTGPRYLALAYRLTAYQGVMATRTAKEKEQRDAAPEARPDVRGGDGATEVSLSAFRAQFPGLVSTTKSG